MNKIIAYILVSIVLSNAWSLIPKTTEESKQDSIVTECNKAKAYMLWVSTLGSHHGKIGKAERDSTQKAIDFWCGQAKR